MYSKSCIHQFSPSVTWGDGVTQGILYFQQLLKRLGFESCIYAKQIDPKLEGAVLPLASYISHPDQWLLYHYSILDDDAETIMAFADHKVMVYHNITPAHFFAKDSFLHYVCTLSREQLRAISSHFEGAIADSSYNAQELLSCNYQKPLVLPILCDENLQMMPDRSIIDTLKNRYTILFVGRLVSNKCQHDLVETLYALRLRGINNVTLILAGGISQSDYVDFLRERIRLLELEDAVILAGKVSEEVLSGYYHAADLYLSLSEHEGFGIPLIEAMRHDIPVLAYASTAINENITKEGTLFKKSPHIVAQAIMEVMHSPMLRHHIREKQHEILKRFSTDTLLLALQKWLKTLKITSCIPYVSSPTIKAMPSVLIEGPFDSTYSLAKVNRDMAYCFHQKGFEVALHSTEGGGDFMPDEDFLNEHLDIAAYHQHYLPQKLYDIVIRNLYPPRTNAMAGKCKILGPYGWEESAFPSSYMEFFNQRLDALWCMSSYVRKTLIDNGLSIPSITTGIIADEILRQEAEDIGFGLPAGWRILHVSSAFPRKGVDVLIAGFCDFHAHVNDAVLILKTFPNPHNVVFTELEKHNFVQIGQLSLIATLWETPTGACVVWIDGDISMSQMRFLYEGADVLVAPSRGEGFGLPMAEAMFLKIPVIATGYGGQCDFCTPETSWLIDYRFAKAQTHMDLFDSVWVDPCKDDLVKQLIYVNQSTTEEKELRTQNAYALIEKHYSLQAFGEKLPLLLTCKEKVFNMVQNERLGWVSTWNSRCGIATYSKHLTQHLDLPTIILAPYANECIDADHSCVVRCWSDKGDDTLKQLEEVVTQHKLTIIVLQFNYNFFNFEALSKWVITHSQKGLKICIALHSTVDQEREDKKLSLLANAFKLCHRIFVHSIDDLNRLKNIGIIGNATLFPHGILDWANSLSKNISLPTVQLASYGFFLPNKGLLELIEATAILRNTGHRIVLNLINARYPLELSDSLIEQARALIRSLDLELFVILKTDFLTDEVSLAFLGNADLIIFPYQYTGESASGAVRYGLTTEVPVAVTPLPIFDDLGEAVFRLPGTTPEEIAKGIETILQKLDTKKEIAQRWKEAHRYSVLGPRLKTILLS